MALYVLSGSGPLNVAGMRLAHTPRQRPAPLPALGCCRKIPSQRKQKGSRLPSRSRQGAQGGQGESLRPENAVSTLTWCDCVFWKADY